MKKLIVIAALLIIALTTATLSVLYHTQAASPGGTMTICQGTPIPSGYVVIGFQNLTSCVSNPYVGLGPVNNAEVIAPVQGEQMIICVGSAPPGYVVAGYTYQSECVLDQRTAGLPGTNATIIQKVH